MSQEGEDKYLGVELTRTTLASIPKKDVDPSFDLSRIDNCTYLNPSSPRSLYSTFNRRYTPSEGQEPDFGGQKALI